MATDIAAAKAHREETHFDYTTRDAILYALGIGCTAKDDLRYVYEGDKSFLPYPTYIVAPGITAVMDLTSWPGLNVNMTRVLHGEQYIESFAPLPTNGRLRSEVRLIEALDKGSGLMYLSEVTSYNDATNEKVAMQQFATFQVGAGGFGGPRTCDEEKRTVPVPERQPDAVVEEKTTVDQATLYRLGSLDFNPLHVDPAFAQKAGFGEPILHGLCTLGFATRHIIKTWAGNDASKFKAVKVRFTSPVTPGNTLQTEMWKEGKRIHFQVRIKETGKLAVSSSYVDLTEASATPTVPEHLTLSALSLE